MNTCNNDMSLKERPFKSEEPNKNMSPSLTEKISWHEIHSEKLS